MKPLCEEHTPPPVMRKSLEHMDAFANQGYRVMLAGIRRVSEEEFAVFKEQHHRASTTITGRDKAMDDVYATMERDLLCVGVTCVEDKLQDEVPDTVQYLLRAKMHVWILTGDKLETAINIAHSSSIIDRDCMATAVIEGDEWSDIGPLARSALELAPGSKGKALVIGGHALAVMTEAGHIETFVELCEKCQVVVCARCAPVQKAEVVTLVMKRLKKISLAIGDGGNDVPMILSADVGVGIMGNEGMQASRSADFSIGQYRLLKRLLAVHGRYSSLRMADLIKYSFYKNVCFCTPQVVFAAYNLFSANTLHNEWIILAYNIVFTGLQPLAAAIFEKDLSEDLIDLFPEAYCTEERRNPLTATMLMEWEAHAVFQGVLFAFAALYGVAAREDTAFVEDGRAAGMDTTGFLLSSMVVWCVTAKYYVMIRSFTIMHYIAIWLSLLGFYVGLMILNFWYDDDAGVAVNGAGIINLVVLNELRSWLTVLCFVVLAATPDVVIAFLRRNYAPSEWQILQAADRFTGRQGLERLSYKTTALPGEGSSPPLNPLRETLTTARRDTCRDEHCIQEHSATLLQPVALRARGRMCRTGSVAL
eukprot:CAMPEP_0196723520 /NCGR_PEP_ID=MMETSP1091-20130531/5625_1 /TAXON_ID=302021 /ORGANISM="Rhodomonas sp., Strain CCMP768" /LENGTH=590 /DNA_ID=CAMNT_0042065465 /DNA_START=1 /DNA_END=1774 /DNA_ORIENTATION=-